MKIKELINRIELSYQKHDMSLLSELSPPLSQSEIHMLAKTITDVVGYSIPDEILQLYSIANGDEDTWPSLFQWTNWHGMELLVREYKHIHTKDMFRDGILIRKPCYYKARWKDRDDDMNNFEDYSNVNHLLPIGYHSEPGWLFVDLSKQYYGRLILSSVVEDADVLAPSLYDYLNDFSTKTAEGTYKFNPAKDEFETPVSWYEKTTVI